MLLRGSDILCGHELKELFSLYRKGIVSSRELREELEYRGWEHNKIELVIELNNEVSND